MNNLKLIEETGMIKIYETDKGEQVVNARELHSGLEVKGDFSHWIKSNLTNVDALKNEDFILLVFKDEQDSHGGHNKKEYILKLEIAKEICMIAGANPRANKELKQKSKEYRKYLIEVEKRYKAQAYPKLSKELQAIFALDGRQQELESRLDKLECDMYITPQQRKELLILRNRKIFALIGNSKSDPYRNQSFRSRVYAELSNQYHNYFDVCGYAYTPRNRFEEAKEVIGAYNLSMDLTMELKKILERKEVC